MAIDSKQSAYEHGFSKGVSGGSEAYAPTAILHNPTWHAEWRRGWRDGQRSVGGLLPGGGLSKRRGGRMLRLVVFFLMVVGAIWWLTQDEGTQSSNTTSTEEGALTNAPQTLRLPASSPTITAISEDSAQDQDASRSDNIQPRNDAASTDASDVPDPIAASTTRAAIASTPALQTVLPSAALADIDGDLASAQIDQLTAPNARAVADADIDIDEAPDAPDFARIVRRAQFAERIENREPVNRLANTASIKDISRLYFFSEIRNYRDHVVSHHWYFNGRKTQVKTFSPIAGNRWRVYSYETLREGQGIGTWEVRIYDENSALMATHEIVITD